MMPENDITAQIGENPRGVVSNMLARDIVVSEFEL